jgi:hypothetical protein
MRIKPLIIEKSRIKQKYDTLFRGKKFLLWENSEKKILSFESNKQ